MATPFWTRDLTWMCKARDRQQKVAETNGTPRSVNCAHKWNAIVQKKIKTLRRQSYKQKITSLRKPTELWNMVNVLKKLKVGEPLPPLTLNGEYLVYPQDKANLSLSSTNTVKCWNVSNKDHWISRLRQLLPRMLIGSTKAKKGPVKDCVALRTLSLWMIS